MTRGLGDCGGLLGVVRRWAPGSRSPGSRATCARTHGARVGLMRSLPPLAFLDGLCAPWGRRLQIGACLLEFVARLIWFFFRIRYSQTVWRGLGAGEGTSSRR